MAAHLGYSRGDLVSRLESLLDEATEFSPDDPAKQELLEQAEELSDVLQSTAADFFVRENRFQEYAMFLAEEPGIDTTGWPYSCIDWVKAARELRMDYSAVVIDGETYYARS